MVNICSSLFTFIVMLLLLLNFADYKGQWQITAVKINLFSYDGQKGDMQYLIWQHFIMSCKQCTVVYLQKFTLSRFSIWTANLHNVKKDHCTDYCSVIPTYFIFRVFCWNLMSKGLVDSYINFCHKPDWSDKDNQSGSCKLTFCLFCCMTGLGVSNCERWRLRPSVGGAWLGLSVRNSMLFNYRLTWNLLFICNIIKQQKHDLF